MRTPEQKITHPGQIKCAGNIAPTMQYMPSRRPVYVGPGNIQAVTLLI